MKPPSERPAEGSGNKTTWNEGIQSETSGEVVDISLSATDKRLDIVCGRGSQANQQKYANLTADESAATASGRAASARPRRSIASPATRVCALRQPCCLAGSALRSGPAPRRHRVAAVRAEAQSQCGAAGCTRFAGGWKAVVIAVPITNIRTERTTQ
uniref:Transposase n=1 Tax=Angiostrongylus cantonensis TaxID=6313 RepID=A0A0K0DJ92_ANGCA